MAVVPRLLNTVKKKKKEKSRASWHLPVIPALRKEQEDQKFKISPHRGTLSHKAKITHNRGKNKNQIQTTRNPVWEFQHPNNISSKKKRQTGVQVNINCQRHSLE